MPVTYDNDVLAWSAKQAELIRLGQFDKLDIAHIADEIEDVAGAKNASWAAALPCSWPTVWN